MRGDLSRQLGIGGEGGKHLSSPLRVADIERLGEPRGLEDVINLMEGSGWAIEGVGLPCWARHIGPVGPRRIPRTCPPLG